MPVSSHPWLMPACALTKRAIKDTHAKLVNKGQYILQEFFVFGVSYLTVVVGDICFAAKHYQCTQSIQTNSTGSIAYIVGLGNGGEKYNPNARRERKYGWFVRCLGFGEVVFVFG